MSPKGSLGSRIFLSRASSCAAATSPAGAALSVGARWGWGVASRTVHDLGDPLSGRPIDLHICYSTHRCLACRRSFPADQSDLAPLKSQYTHRVQQTAVRLVIEDDMPYRMASWHLCATTAFLFLGPPSRIGSRPRGKKSRAAVDTVYLEAH